MTLDYLYGARAAMRSRPAAAAVLMHACVLALALAPLVATSALFLVDIPNHAFRSGIIMDLLNGKESTFYEFRLRLIPNLPIDVFAALTRNLLDPIVAVAVLTCAACAGFYLSVIYWRWLMGKPTRLWICLLLVVVLYSRPLYYGLINYIVAIAIMNVCLARLEARAENPSLGFCAGQTVLVVLMYLSNAIAVFLYFSWSLGTFLFDAVRNGRAGLRTLVIRSAQIHLPPFLILLALMLTAHPIPPAEKIRTMWAIDLKINATWGSIGQMSMLQHEILFAAFFAALLAFGFWTRRLRIGLRQWAGLCGMVACFIAVPGKLLGALLVDTRMPMAIVAAGLAVLEEAPVSAASRYEAIRNLLVGVLVGARLTLLAVFWTPLQTLPATYAELARLVEDRSAVFFVAPQGRGEPIDVWHLHTLAFSGRDVYLSQTFFNFTVDRKPTARFRVTETPVNGSLISDVLSTDPYTHVLSHEDLSTLELRGKRLCLLAERPAVALYRVLAAPDARPANVTRCE